MKAGISLNYYLHHGKPTVAGTHVTVEDVAQMYLTWWDAESIAARFGLTLAQVHLALSYYYDHKEDIDNENHR